jgi:hypothetical protein
MMRLQIRDDMLKHVHIVGAGAGAFPIQIAGHPLADEFTPAQTRQGTDMRVGQVGKKNFHAANLLLFASRHAAPRKYLCGHLANPTPLANDLEAATKK